MEMSQTPSGAARKSKKNPFVSGKIVKVVITVLVVMAAITLGLWFMNRSSVASTIDSSKYQAVFFTNGQVYFGKLSQVNAGYFRLTDVFYIQQSSQTENPQETNGQSSDIELIKLGKEVHGPEDAMIISKEQVLFFENLTGDGKVTQSIDQYNQKQE